jgi:aspartate kinase
LAGPCLDEIKNCGGGADVLKGWKAASRETALRGLRVLEALCRQALLGGDRLKKIKIGGILQHRSVASITVTGILDRPGVASRIFRTLGAHQINVEFIVHTIDEHKRSNVNFCVERKNLVDTLALLEPYRSEIGFTKLVYDQRVGLVSIFGPHFRERTGIAGILFHALGSADINILAISTSISTCTCLIAEQDMDRAVAALSEAFELPG